MGGGNFRFVGRRRRECPMARFNGISYRSCLPGPRRRAV